MYLAAIVEKPAPEPSAEMLLLFGAAWLAGMAAIKGGV